MNFSRNVNLLKTIDDTLDDKIYVGVTESKGVLEAIDNNLVIIDGVLDASNVHLSNINTAVSGQASSLSAIETSNQNIDSSLDAVENKLIDLGVTLSRNNKFNVTQTHQPLKDSSDDRLISLADFSSTPARLYYENDAGKPIVITKISLSVSSSETTWDKLFTSSTAGFLKFGIGDDNTGIDTTKLNFANNHDIQPYMSMVFADPAGGDEMYYSYVIDGLNIRVSDGKYFVCELTGDYSAAGDGSFAASVVFDKYTGV